MFRPSFPIRTARLLLRPFGPGDVDALHQMQGSEEMTRYLPYGARTREEVAAILPRLQAMTAIDGVSEGVRLAGVLAATDQVVGDYSLWRRSVGHATGEIGYVTHPDHAGHGYATEAAGELLRLAFDEVGLHRVVASADPRNRASTRVMEHLGMRQEAYFRQAEQTRGEWTDEVVYAILVHEWRARGRQGQGTNGG